MKKYNSTANNFIHRLNKHIGLYMFILIVISSTQPVLGQSSAEVDQDFTVTGQVIDASSEEGLPGVNVMIKGTTTGTSTDTDGSFKITVPSVNDILVFSFIGYQTEEIPIDERSRIDIAMEPQAVVGQEMVVTAFGLEREERSLAYSTQDVNTTALTEARELNVMQSLQGKVAGLSINAGAEGLGSDTRVVLRGNRSINGDSQPLYVVDGVPVRGGINGMNADNITSMNVLKGPNAAALYGSAAQNGAIVIETSKGRPNEIDIRLNNTFMMRKAKNNYLLQNEYGQGSQGVYDKGSEFNWGPKMEGQMVDHWSPDPSMANEQYAFTPQPNNIDRFFDTGYNMSNSILASIGGETTQSVFAYTHTDAKGVLPNNKMKRHNVSLRLNTDLTDRFHLDSKIDYMQEDVKGGNQSTVSLEPWRHIVRIPRNISNEQFSNFEYETPEGNMRQNYFNPGSSIGANPYWIMERALRERNEERILAMTSLTYDFTDALSFMVRVSYDGSSGGFDEKLYNDNYRDGINGLYTVGESNSSLFNGDFRISYTEDISEDWSIDANFAGSIEKQRNNSVSTNTGDAFLIPNFFTIDNTLRQESSHSYGSPFDIHSLYSFAQIDWRDQIYLDISGRNDWSSTLPSGSRSYFYPSVGVSAVVSDLIPELTEPVSYVKLRASWSETGSGAPPQMGAREAHFYAGGTQGYLEFDDTLPTKNLRPERTESFELGADLRFINNRIGLDFTYYHSNTYDQLFTLQLPVGSGASELFTNGGNVQNKGVEILLSTSPVESTDINWDLNINYAANHSLVKQINDARPKIVRSSGAIRDFVIEEGRPYGELYSRGWLRDDQGRVIVASNGVPRTTGGKTVNIGNFSPDWTGGIINEISYKNINASFLIDHRQGGVVVSRAEAVLAADGTLARTIQGREGGLIFGENIFSEETAVMDDGSPNTVETNAETLWRQVGGRSQPAGEVFTNDATNTRLREVTIGYSLPQSLLASFDAISSVKFSLVGRNLFYLYRATPTLDADFLDSTGPANEGSQYFAPPTTRSFGANLSIDF